MAKRKKTTSKKSTGRKYRVYARKVGSVGVSDVIAGVVGGVASRWLTNQAGKVVPAIVASPQMKAGFQLLLGVVTPPLANALGVKNASVAAASKGMMFAGGYELIRAVAPTALGAAEDGSDVIVVSGTDISEINGLDEIGNMDISEMNGLDEIGMFDDDID